MLPTMRNKIDRLTSVRRCARLKKGNAQIHLVVSTGLIIAAPVEGLGGYFFSLLHFKVREHAKN